LKYVKIGLERESFIGGLQRISKTSRREYTKARNMPRLLGGVGRYVLSTTRGLMTDRKALKLGVGGEVLFSVYSRY
jgi:small subunit ribosomal protein S8